MEIFVSRENKHVSLLTYIALNDRILLVRASHFGRGKIRRKCVYLLRLKYDENATNTLFRRKNVVLDVSYFRRVASCVSVTMEVRDLSKTVV